MTTKKFIFNSLYKEKKEENEIIKSYFKMLPQEISQIIIQDRKKSIDGENGSNITKNESEQKKIESIETKIYEKEKKYIKKFIPVPKEKLCVMVIPGHGFESPGARFKNKENEKIEEKKLNQLVSYNLILKLLEKNYEVYVPFDFEENDLVLPYSNSKLHVIFKGYRPPVTGEKSENGQYRKDMINLTSSIMLATAEKIKENKPKSKFISISLNHNSTGDENLYGFIPFYRKTGPIDFLKNSKKLSNILLNNCKEIYKGEGKDVSSVKQRNYLVNKQGPEAALLIELGFGTNKKQLEECSKESKIKKMADALEKSITKYFNN